MASITRSHRSSMFFFRFLVVPFLHIQRKQGQHPPQHLFASNTYHLHEPAAEVTPTYPVHTKGGILITGASTGIGLHAAQHLSALGFRVYAGVRSSKAAEQVKQAGGEDFLGRKGKGKQCRMNCGGWTLWTHFFCTCMYLFWSVYLFGSRTWFGGNACRRLGFEIWLQIKHDSKAQDITPKNTSVACRRFGASDFGCDLGKHCSKRLWNHHQRFGATCFDAGGSCELRWSFKVQKLHTKNNSEKKILPGMF